MTVELVGDADHRVRGPVRGPHGAPLLDVDLCHTRDARPQRLSGHAELRGDLPESVGDLSQAARSHVAPHHLCGAVAGAVAVTTNERGQP